MACFADMECNALMSKLHGLHTVKIDTFSLTCAQFRKALQLPWAATRIRVLSGGQQWHGTSCSVAEAG